MSDQIMRKSAGFSLLEAMVAILVVSIGLLGLAALQANALSFNSIAYQRSQATNLVYDIIDRMRVNIAAARSGRYNFDEDALGEQDPILTSTELVAVDIREWRRAISNTLPSAKGRIEIQDTGMGTVIVQVTIQWDDSRGKNPPQQFSTTTQL